MTYALASLYLSSVFCLSEQPIAHFDHETYKRDSATSRIFLTQAQENDELKALMAQLERLKREKEALQQQVNESSASTVDKNREVESADPFNSFLTDGTQATGGKQDATQSTGPSFSDFGRADIIQLLHAGELEPLEASPLRSLIYVANLSTKLADQSTLFLLENRRVILMTVDPTVATRAAQKLASSRRGTQELTNAGTQTLFGMLGAIADTRRDKGSIQDELQSLNSAAANSPTVQLNMIKQQAEFDAIKLAFMSETHPEDFKKIYRSIRLFISR